MIQIMLLPHPPHPDAGASHPHPQFVAAKSLMLIPPELSLHFQYMHHGMSDFHSEDEKCCSSFPAEAVAEGNERAALALKVFAHKVKFYIGAYIAEMNGVDAIVFTAGLGENSGTTRRAICDYLGFLGVHIDSYNNSLRGKALEISATDSRVRVFVIPTNEELVIARDTKELLDK